jgi:hypothetical protein
MIHHVVHAYACIEGNPKRDRIKGHYDICDGVAGEALHYAPYELFRLQREHLRYIRIGEARGSRKWNATSTLEP